ncbi:rRNA methyltransferase [Caldifermentibacillus hisashii]|jgi:hypothetical protein|uniref:rRNA methyltransferase n=1 Tax=Bacillaceae TaxID=186817 RepID=UPI0022E13261|nr:rRNA methyltransferase [Caldibacillus thermoamylovorans]
MYKLVDNKIVSIHHSQRVKFRTNVSKSLLLRLAEIASEYKLSVNHLIENGLENLLKANIVPVIDKNKRPKDRVQYKTTYNANLLANVKSFAGKHGFRINDLIEYSEQFIDMNQISKHSGR